jgi:hypothetical protein
VYKKHLIALITLCAGVFAHTAAQTAAMPEATGLKTMEHVKPLYPEDPGRKYRKKNSKFPKDPSPDNPVKSNIRLDPVPVPDYPARFTMKKYPLPSYLGLDGEYKIDCLWVKSHPYFSVWENNKLNPYGINGEHFEDTIRLVLFNPNDSILWHSPLDKTIITSDFGLRRASWHYGIDFRVKVGVPVYAAFDGIVRVIGYERRGFGRFLVIRHTNGLESVYAHLSRTFFNLGEEVKSGEVIGYGGNTGRSTAPHLHFELRYAGNAINPNLVFDFDTNQIRDQEFKIEPDVFAYLEEANKIRYHRVRRGDTLSGIGYRYGVTISKLCRLNGIRRTSILQIGQRIRIN